MIAERLVYNENNSSMATDIPAEPSMGRYRSLQRRKLSAIFYHRDTQEMFQAEQLLEKHITKKSKEPKVSALDKIIGLNIQSVSNLTGLTDMVDPLPSPIYQKPYRITESAHDFIRKQKKSFALNESLDRVSNRILEFMRERCIESEIIIDLEVDPEYGDWIEPKIQVLVESSKFEKAYELLSQLLEFSLKGIRKKETKRFMITVDVK